MRLRRSVLAGAASLAAAWLVLGAAGAPVAQDTGTAVSNPIGEAFPLVFDSEWVRLDVVGDSLEVHTTFVFRCREPIHESIPLFFPFPRDSLLGGAHMVSLRFHPDAGGSGRWEEMPLDGVRWWVPPCRGDSLVAEAVYRQKILARYARYIVTTARLWGRPLRYAEFEIRLPPRAEPVEFSYPFVRRGQGAKAYYAYETEGFFPDRDVVVRWRRE